MKKLLSTVAIGALLTTGAMADDGDFDVIANVPATTSITLINNLATGTNAAIVAEADLGTISAQNRLEAGIILDMGELTLDADNERRFDVKISTNTKNDVTIALTTTPALVHASVPAQTVATTYAWDIATTTTGGSVAGDVLTASTGATRNDALAGELVITSTPTSTQLAGDYSANVVVAVVAL